VRTSPPPDRRFLREPRHVVASLRLLVFAGLAVLGWSAPPAQPLLYWLVTVVYGVTVIGYMMSRNGDFGLRRVRFAIFLFDAAVVSGLIVLRGRDVQDLVMAYFMLVFLTALLAGVGRPLLNALIIAFIYVVVSARLLPSEELLSMGHVGQLFFFFVTAVFMGHVAREDRPRLAVHSPALLPASGLNESTARLRCARERLNAKERLRTLGMLCAGIAHELRMPLAAIHASMKEAPGLLEELEAASADGQSVDGVVAEMRDVLKDCQHATGQLRHVARGLNDMGNPSGASTYAEPVSEVFSRVERLLRRDLAPSITLEIASESSRSTRGDPACLQQVLLNLAGNSIDAMSASRGGRLRITAEDSGSDGIALLVEDEGPGMSPELLECMYDPFYTTKVAGQGTGLGLYVVREIVHGEGGKIICHSTPGEGTSFRVELPGPLDAGDVVESAA